MKRALIVAAVAAVMMAGPATATDYTVIGSGSAAYYSVNVAYRLDADMMPMSSIFGEPFLSPGVALQSGSDASQLIDGNRSGWYLRNLEDAQGSRYATTTIELDQVYTLNTLTVAFADVQAQGTMTYQLRVSDDNENWYTVTPSASITNRVFHPYSFAAMDVKYIEYTIYGSIGAQGHLTTAEISAFVAAVEGAKGVPQHEDGYNILMGKTPISSKNFADITRSTNGNATEYARLVGASADNMGELVYDIGYDAWLTGIQVSMWAGWDHLQVYVTTDDPTGSVCQWTPIRDATQSLALTAGDDGKFLFDDPTQVRYIKIEGYAGALNGHVVELMAFATIPEPATMSLLALGGLALLRRKR